MSNTLHRRALLGAALLVATLSVSPAARAQGTNPGGFGVRPYVGAYIPTGDQGDFLKSAVLIGAQALFTVNENLTLLGTAGWTPPKDKITPGDRTLDLWQYDLGAELRSAELKVGDVTPFIGLGVGGRTYNYENLDVSAKTVFDGYGALGVDIGTQPLGVRIEARNYLSRFEPITGTGKSSTRNDVTIAAGLTVRF